MAPLPDDDRTPPKKIRITKLQEAQLMDLAAIEARCAQMFYEGGLGEAEIKPRSDLELAQLTRDHDILVVEADDHPAGFLVWADEPPGVAVIHDLMVTPTYQRFGVATRLLVELGERAVEHGITHAVAAPFRRASFSLAFLGVRGFVPLSGEAAPAGLQDWIDRRAETFVADGQELWWAKTDGLGFIPGLPRPSTPPR